VEIAVPPAQQQQPAAEPVADDLPAVDGADSPAAVPAGDDLPVGDIPEA